MKHAHTIMGVAHKFAKAIHSSALFKHAVKGPRKVLGNESGRCIAMVVIALSGWMLLLLSVLGVATPASIIKLVVSYEAEYGYLFLLSCLLLFAAIILLIEWRGIFNRAVLGSRSLSDIEKKHPYLPKPYQLASSMLLSITFPFMAWTMGNHTLALTGYASMSEMDEVYTETHDWAVVVGTYADVTIETVTQQAELELTPLAEHFEAGAAPAFTLLDVQFDESEKELLDIDGHLNNEKALEAITETILDEQDIAQAVLKAVLTESSEKVAKDIVEDSVQFNKMRDAVLDGGGRPSSRTDVLQDTVEDMLQNDDVLQKTLAYGLRNTEEVQDVLEALVTEDVREQVIETIVSEALNLSPKTSGQSASDIQILQAITQESAVLKEVAVVAVSETIKRDSDAQEAVVQTVINNARDENSSSEESTPIVSVSLKGADGKSINVPFHFEHGSVVLVIDPVRRFTPGLYTLEVTITNPVTGEEQLLTQDFAWGVLAMNLDRDRYEPGDTAELNFGVLDDAGEIVCDAELTLAITHPSGTVTTLTTEDDSIETTGTCGTKEAFFIDPDYQAFLTLSEAGEYTFTLEATTDAGTRSTTSSVEVSASVPYTIRRKAATRLWPFDPSRMTIEVTFNQAYAGSITDIVPDGFTVTRSTEYALGSYDDDAGEGTSVTWEGSWNAGETATFEYVYDAPDISPEFYLIGPLQLDPNTGDTTFEERLWQIANDARSTTVTASIINGGKADENVTVSSTSWSTDNGTITLSAAPTSSAKVGDTLTDSGGNRYIITAIAGAVLTAQDFSSTTDPATGAATIQNAYDTITAWEADLDNTTIYDSGDIAIGEAYDDGGAYSENITIDGGGTIGLTSVKLAAAEGERHGGTFDTGVKIIASTANGITVDTTYATTIDGLVITNTYALTGFPSGITFTQANNSLTISRNIIAKLRTSTDATRVAFGIRASGSAATKADVKIINNIIYRIGTEGGTSPLGGRAISAATHSDAGSAVIANNTVYNTAGTSSGITAFYGTIKNNISLDAGAGDFYFDGGTATTTNNISSDTTGSTGLQNLSASDLFVSITSDSENLHLKAGAAAINAGADLGTTPTGVNLDIDGRDRDAMNDTWDIGADEYVAGATPTGTGSITGAVWSDADGDGVKDGGETTGIQSVTISISGTTATGQALAVSNQTTTSTGAYTFGDLVRSNPSGYTVAVASGTPAGYLRTGFTSSGGNIVSTGSTLTVNFGFVRKSTLSGSVFEDLDEDGVKDSGETDVFSGSTLTLTGTTNTGGSLNVSVTSNSIGVYLFPSLPPGSYTLAITAPDGYESTSTDSRSVSITQGGEADLEHFGYLAEEESSGGGSPAANRYYNISGGGDGGAVSSVEGSQTTLSSSQLSSAMTSEALSSAATHLQSSIPTSSTSPGPSSSKSPVPSSSQKSDDPSENEESIRVEVTLADEEPLPPVPAPAEEPTPSTIIERIAETADSLLPEFIRGEPQPLVQYPVIQKFFNPLSVATPSEVLIDGMLRAGRDSIESALATPRTLGVLTRDGTNYLGGMFGFDREDALYQAALTLPEPEKRRTVLRRIEGSFNVAELRVKPFTPDGDVYRNTRVVLFSTPQFAQTDEDGVALFTNVEAGEHTIEVHGPQFVDRQHINIDLPASLLDDATVTNVAVNIPDIQIVVDNPHESAPGARGLIGAIFVISVVSALINGLLYLGYRGIRMLARRRTMKHAHRS